MDIIEGDNEFLTRKVNGEEIFKVVKQINPVKAPDSDSQVIF